MLIFCEAEPQENQHQTPTRQPVHTGSQHNSAVPQDSCTEHHPSRTEPSIHYWSSLSVREIKQRLSVGQTWRRGSFPYRCCGGTALITDTIQSSRPARRWTQRPSDTRWGASSSSVMCQAVIIIIIAKLSLALLPKYNISQTICCDPVYEIQAQVSKNNYEITSIKVWFKPFISLWFQSLTWPYSANIKDIKVTFHSVLYFMKGDFM